MLSDPIADMLTRIRNGYMIKKETVAIPHSKIKAEIARVLMERGFIKSMEVTEDGVKKSLVVTLKYDLDKPSISKMKRISKAGRRIYSSKEKLPVVLSNLGVAIISTSKGIMTADEARKQNIGGEIVCTVW